MKLGEPLERARLARIRREIDQIAGETPAFSGLKRPVSGIALEENF